MEHRLEWRITLNGICKCPGLCNIFHDYKVELGLGRVRVRLFDLFHLLLASHGRHDGVTGKLLASILCCFYSKVYGFLPMLEQIFEHMGGNEARSSCK